MLGNKICKADRTPHRGNAICYVAFCIVRHEKHIDCAISYFRISRDETRLIVDDWSTINIYYEGANDEVFVILL